MSTNVLVGITLRFRSCLRRRFCKTRYILWNVCELSRQRISRSPSYIAGGFENSSREKRVNLSPDLALHANLQKLLNDFRVPEVVVIGNPRRIWLLRCLTSFWLTLTIYRPPLMKRTVRIT